MGRPEGKNLQILDLHRLASLLRVCYTKPMMEGILFVNLNEV